MVCIYHDVSHDATTTNETSLVPDISGVSDFCFFDIGEKMNVKDSIMNLSNTKHAI